MITPFFLSFYLPIKYVKIDMTFQVNETAIESTCTRLSIASIVFDVVYSQIFDM